MHSNKLSLVESPIPSALSVAPVKPVAPLVPLTIGEVKPKASSSALQAPSSTLPIVSAKKRSLATKAANREKAVSLAAQGRLPVAISEKRNLDEDTLLADLTLTVRAYVSADSDVFNATLDCANAGIERDETIDAIVAGGKSIGYARTVVSKAYRLAGFEKRKTNPNKKPGGNTPEKAVKYASVAVQELGGYEQARKMLQAAAHYCKVQRDAEIALSSKVITVSAVRLANAA